MRRINHSDAYSRDGAHTNHAESYFSRLRRMIGGQHHRVDGKHLGAYAVHAAWLEEPSRSEQWRARRPPDRAGPRSAGQPGLEGILATTRSVTASPGAQTHLPLRFSIILTSLRRFA